MKTKRTTKRTKKAGPWRQSGAMPAAMSVLQTTGADNNRDKKNKVILLYSDGSFSSLKQIYSIDITEVQVKEWQIKGIITKYWV